VDLDTLAAELHTAYDASRLRVVPGRHAEPFEDLLSLQKDHWRAVARRALELLGTARTITVTGL
jgi:hypothetical protein